MTTPSTLKELTRSAPLMNEEAGFKTCLIRLLKTISSLVLDGFSLTLFSLAHIVIYHVLRPLFPPILTRRPGLRERAHPFTLPLKDDKQCIPRVLYRALLPPVQS